MPHRERTPVVPDLLAPGLRVVFCGTAPSHSSAQARAYYANPGNRFWRTLFEIGLTPRQLLPQEYPLLLDYGIGLTDNWKFHVGQDSELPVGGNDSAALEAKILQYQPGVLAFTSKNSAQTALGLKGVPYGLLPRTLGATKLYVCCSTSGRARSFWQQSVWEELAALVVVT